MRVKVELIGLCLLVMNASGFVAILPDWDHGAWIPGANLPDHLAIIAAPRDDVVITGPGWSGGGKFEDVETKKQWVYVVIDGEGIRFENLNMRGPLPSVPDRVPSLRCLCEKCVGIRPKYLTPGSGASSHVYFTSGKAKTRNVHGRVDTIVYLPVRNNGKYLIINGGGGKTLVIKGDEVRVANVPADEISAGFPEPTPSYQHDNHFLAFYKLASTWAGRRCRMTPQTKLMAHALYGIDVDIETLGAGCSNSRYP